MTNSLIQFQEDLRGREVFLALHFANHFPTIMEGLSRRYPKAWEQRARFSFLNDASLHCFQLSTDLLIKKSYCLLEFSKEEDGLRRELQETFLKKSATSAFSFHRFVKQHRKVAELDYEALNQHFEEFVSTSLQYRNAFNQLSFIAFNHYALQAIIQLNQFQLPHDEGYARLVQHWNVVSQTYFGDELRDNRLSFTTLFAQLKQKNSPFYKTMLAYERQISAQLNTKSLADWLTKELYEGEITCHLGANSLAYSLSVINNMQLAPYRLTRSDALEIVAIAICHYCVNEDKTNHFETGEYAFRLTRETPVMLGALHFPDTLSEEDISNLQETFLLIATFLILGRTQQKNQAYMIEKCSNNEDATSIRLLRTEYQQAQRDIERYIRETKQLQDKLVKEKEKHAEQVKKRLKQADETLIKANQKNRQLQEEIERLKEQNETLRQQIKENANEVKKESLINHSPSILSMLPQLNQPNIMIVGGHPNLIRKMKEVLPNCKYCEVDETYQEQYFKGVTHAFIFVEYVNHGMVYQLKKVTPHAQRRILDSTNIERVLIQMQQTLSPQETARCVG